MSELDDDAVRDLASRHGVATSWDGRDGVVTPPTSTLVTVLTALGVLDADGAVVDDADAAPLPPTVVVGPRSSQVDHAVPEGTRVTLVAEDDTRSSLSVEDGHIVLPAELPIGYHHLELSGAVEQTAHLLVAPTTAPTPERGWGVMLQLYAVRSASSWGLGDLGDLRRLVQWLGGRGADFVVVNPLHAAAPTLPQEPSPYYPSSRRAWHPLYIAVDRVPELATADEDVTRRIDELARQARGGAPDRLDRDRVWAAKLEALELLWAQGLTRARADHLDAFIADSPAALRDVAVWSALAEEHGADWHAWPTGLRDSSAEAVGDAAARHADRVRFHCWLQMLCHEQLAAVQVAARHAGMRIGVVHDLAVGVNPAGADAWSMAADLADGATVGAPPDDFNQQGQDWAQPPLLGSRLVETGGAVVREVVRHLLATGGGIRIDHILGWFRLFWVPESGPRDGTYVAMPTDVLLAALLIEAQRAGAIVVGEDLGVVAPGVRETMGERRLLGSRLLYFAFDEAGGRRAALDYDMWTLASITTHDLPTAAGWWRDEGVTRQVELGLLGEGVTEAGERARTATERASMRRLLRAAGLLPGAGPAGDDGAPADEAEAERLVTAMHAFLSRCGSVLVAANLSDMVGDLRQPNLPGTLDEYPNWRLPLARPDGRGGHTPVWLEDLPDIELVQRTIDALSASRPGGT